MPRPPKKSLDSKVPVPAPTMIAPPVMAGMPPVARVVDHEGLVRLRDSVSFRRFLFFFSSIASSLLHKALDTISPANLMLPNKARMAAGELRVVKIGKPAPATQVPAVMI